jgi:hypothetical protein
VLGNAVVKGTFGKHSYDLQVHTLQAIALMEFNATKGEVSTVPLMSQLGDSMDLLLARTLHATCKLLLS